MTSKAPDSTRIRSGGHAQRDDVNACRRHPYWHIMRLVLAGTDGGPVGQRLSLIGGRKCQLFGLRLFQREM